jgi:lipopolysaccharide transport system ATP-binding protein
MSAPIITVENLGKRYSLRHETGERYTTLRDVIANKAKTFLAFKSNNRTQGTGRPDSTSDSSVSGPSKEDFWALRGVSFEVQQGEVVGIIGRNGAGKSTLLKILSRITDPTEGRVKLRGRVASLLEVGTGFHPELTGRENIYLNGAILGMSRAEIRKKFDEIVAFAETERFLDTPVKRYSSGMYVRLAFAVAAHLEPEILVVDEVLAVGDAEFQKKCLGKMNEVSRDGRTVLFVSHNMGAVQVLCARAIQLECGKLCGIGGVEEIIREYLRGLSAGETASASATVSLGAALTLRQLTFHPAAVVSGEPVDFMLEVAPRKPSRLKELALLIYSEYGARVAVLDLRQEGVRDVALRDASLLLKGSIRTLPLVEGAYRIGLFIATEDYHADFLDLAWLNVAGRAAVDEFVPYPVAHRGHVDLEFVVERDWLPTKTV